MDLRAVAERNVPVLCIDTCSILDIIRNPTRNKLRVQDFEAAIEVASAASDGKVSVLIAQQVMVELTGNLSSVRDEADRAIKQLIASATAASNIAAVFGGVGNADLSHLKGHTERAKSHLDNLVTTAVQIIPGPSVNALAFARQSAAVAPAMQGKDSWKDCLVFETYLEALAVLRRLGLTAPAILLSSNTEDYRHDSVATELAALSASYQPNMNATRHALLATTGPINYQLGTSAIASTGTSE